MPRPAESASRLRTSAGGLAPTIDLARHQLARRTPDRAAPIATARPAGGVAWRPATAPQAAGRGDVRDAVPVPLAPAGDAGRPFWNSGTGCFEGSALRRAIVTRGWTVREFAAEAGISLSCLYCALHGRPTIDRTAIAVFQALLLRDPLVVTH